MTIVVLIRHGDVTHSNGERRVPPGAFQFDPTLTPQAFATLDRTMNAIVQKGLDAPAAIIVSPLGRTRATAEFCAGYARSTLTSRAIDVRLAEFIGNQGRRFAPGTPGLFDPCTEQLLLSQRTFDGSRALKLVPVSNTRETTAELEERCRSFVASLRTFGAEDVVWIFSHGYTISLCARFLGVEGVDLEKGESLTLSF